MASFLRGPDSKRADISYERSPFVIRKTTTLRQRKLRRDCYNANFSVSN